jgi:hypothetical protein
MEVITGTDLTGTSDRETFPRSRHKQEARVERCPLSHASLAQVRTSLDRESGPGRKPAVPVARDRGLQRMRATREGPRARDLPAQRRCGLSVAVFEVPQRLANLCLSRDQHG